MAEGVLEDLPSLSLMGEVLFPNGMVTLGIRRGEWDRRAAEWCAGPVFVSALRPGREHLERTRSLYRFGTIARLIPQRIDDVDVEVVAIGLGRARVRSYRWECDEVRALVQPVPAVPATAFRGQQVLSELHLTLRHLARVDPLVSRLCADVLNAIDDPWQLADLIAANLLDDLRQRQRALEAAPPRRRLAIAREILHGFERKAAAQRQPARRALLH